MKYRESHNYIFRPCLSLRGVSMGNLNERAALLIEGGPFC